MPISKVSQAGLTSGAQYFTFKNRIINGAIDIDQRNAGANTAYTPTSKTYFADRFAYRMPTIGSASVNLQQVSDAPAGFTKSLKVTVNVAGTPTTGNRLGLSQDIEGYNIADFAWNTASASSVTLSFWVKSSITGTFGVSLRNIAVDGIAGLCYVSSYTINSANTWEYKTVTISGYTGTAVSLNNTSNTGIVVVWDMGSGSNYNVTPNQWLLDDGVRVTNAERLITNSGATWQITGVQLEKGSTATSFDYRPYGTELAMCQRYYTQWTGVVYLCQIRSDSGVKAMTYSFKQSMRAAPTVTITSTTGTGTFSTPSVTTEETQLFVTGASTTGGTSVQGFTATSEL